MTRTKRFHGLKKIRLRQTFSKYNLYNLSRSKPTDFFRDSLNFFRQKWMSKAATRNYHGETIREKQWTRMFRKSISAVMPMDHKSLAEDDGSQQAEGRGSGLENPRTQTRNPRIPFMSMVYAPAERRLDTSIHRALFASSTRQARQFVVHGDVKVNGKKMIYPGYQLNPGDMFQVEPERVLYALGAPKDSSERRAGRKLRNASLTNAEGDGISAGEMKDVESSSSPAAKQSALLSGDPAKAITLGTPKERMQSLLNQAKTLLSTSTKALTARQKKDLRSFQRSVKQSWPRPNDLSTSSLDTQLQKIIARITLPADKASPALAADIPEMSSRSLQAEAGTLTPNQMDLLREALQQSRENPIDAKKPYATPWRPRDYLSPFAFIPKYLEVHQKICSAIYLRHPVARPGMAEVPTPFSPETMSMTHNWYLRRR